MVKPALAASRAVRVLDYLSLHPGQPRSLTEIANALEVSAASMLAVLGALTDAGYLVRHPAHKTYVIGPALVAVGHAAMTQHPLLPAAQHELELVADAIEAQCASSVVMGSDLVAVAVAGRPRRVVTWTRIGSRVPFGPPFGAPFAAFGSDADRRRWLSARVGGSDMLDAQLVDALAVVRERGYAAGREDEVRERLGRALSALGDEPANERLRSEVQDLLGQQCESFVVVNSNKRGTEPLDVSHVTVPVFAPSGGVVMILTAGGFPQRLNGAAIEEVAASLQASAEVIAAQAFGPAPLSSSRSRVARPRKSSSR